MKNMNSLKSNIILGTVFVLITGTISHFIYDWSGQNYILGLIFPTNESTWEHMKLVFFPMLLCAFFLNRRLMADYPCITSALFAGILLGTFLIPILFYSYSGILGNHFFWLDIAVFALSVITAFWAACRLTLSCRAKNYGNLFGLLVFVVLLCFLFFTYHAPALGLFADPTKQF